MCRSYSANSWSRVVVVSAMTFMLLASTSIRKRGFVAAFSCVDFTRANARSFHSLEKGILASETSIYSNNGNSDFCKSGPAGWHRSRTSLQMSTSSPSSASTDSKVLRRVKAIDAKQATDGTPVLIKGWVRTVRKQKTLAFVEVNDGSNMNGIQCVLSFDSIDDDTKNGMVMIVVFADLIF
jgi:hypothetical protein